MTFEGYAFEGYVICPKCKKYNYVHYQISINCIYCAEYIDCSQ